MRDEVTQFSVAATSQTRLARLPETICLTSAPSLSTFRQRPKTHCICCRSCSTTLCWT